MDKCIIMFFSLMLSTLQHFSHPTILRFFSFKEAPRSLLMLYFSSEIYFFSRLMVPNHHYSLIHDKPKWSAWLTMPGNADRAVTYQVIKRSGQTSQLTQVHSSRPPVALRIPPTSFAAPLPMDENRKLAWLAPEWLASETPNDSRTKGAG